MHHRTLPEARQMLFTDIQAPAESAAKAFTLALHLLIGLNLRYIAVSVE